MRISDWSSDVCSSDLFIALVQRLVLRPWNGIIRIAVRARIFIGDAGFRIGLASEMLILRDTGVCRLRVGIVDHGHRLEPFMIHRFMPELKGDRTSTRLNSSH